MATNLTRRLTSLPKLHSFPDSLIRLLTTSPLHHSTPSTPSGKTPPAEQTPSAEDTSSSSESSSSSSSDDDVGEHVNKNTGEIGGPCGPEPTRYGDWEKGGRCSDF